MRARFVPLLVAAVLLASGGFHLRAQASAASGIKPGDKAPDFTLPDQDGNMVSLKDFANKKAVVLYFYPKDDIGVCKKEACLFRDQYQSFKDQGAEVLGISSDSVKSHEAFASRRHLPFKLLSDKKGEVRKLYAVPHAAAGILPGRVTFVIDKQGTVRLSFNSLLNADKHISEALAVVKSMSSGDEPQTSREHTN